MLQFLFGIFMANFAYSTYRGCNYCYDGCIKIINLKQILFYINEGVEIKDIFPSINYQTGEKILTFVVDIFESQSTYNKWQRLKDKEFKLRNLKTVNVNGLYRTLNTKEVIYLLEKKCQLKHCLASLDLKTQQPVLAFYFDPCEVREFLSIWKNKKPSA